MWGKRTLEKMAVLLMFSVVVASAPLAARAQESVMARAQEARLEIMQYWKAHDQDSVEAVYEEVQKLARSAPDNPELARILGAMAAGSTLMYVSMDQLDKAGAMYGNIDAIRQRFPDNDNIAWAQIQTAEFMSTFFRTRKDAEKADAFMKDIKALSDLWPDHKGIAAIRKRVGNP